MAKENVLLQQFNRGIISPLALARTDVGRTAFSAVTMTNWMPRVLGSMSLRPGMKYLGATNSNAAAKFIPFVFSTDDTALIEISASGVRFWESDAVLSFTKGNSSVANGSFTTTTGWTDADDSGATSTLASGADYLSLIGDGTNYARRRQTVTLNAADYGVGIHLQVVVHRGPVVVRVGTTSSSDNLISEKALETGRHVLKFTPYSDFVIELESNLEREVLVNSCDLLKSTSAPISLVSPWGADDLDNIRWQQSGNYVYIACDGVKPKQIIRYGVSSWGLADYLADDGPYRNQNITEATITPSALTGSITLTASEDIFKGGNRDTLYAIESDGQLVSSDITAQATWTNAIKVEGVDSQRVFTVIVEGTWVATVTLQRSLTSDAGPWEDVQTWTANTVGNFDDTLDNQIAWYRIGVDTGDFTSGTVEAQLDYPIGSIRGVARVTSSRYTYEAQSAATNETFNGICWAEGISLFIAVAQDNIATNLVNTSPDGFTWTARTSAAARRYESVAWSDDLTIAVAVSYDGTTSAAMSSPDGITWTARTTPDDTWYDVCYSEDLTLFVAVGSGSTNQVMTSANGTSWTGRTAADSNGGWLAVTYSPGLGLFVAVRSNSTDRVMTSSDGITWSLVNVTASTWENVIWVDSLGVFIATASSSDTYMYSSDGSTWTDVDLSDIFDAIYEVVWLSVYGELHMFGGSGSENIVATSVNGVNWVKREATPYAVERAAYSPSLNRVATISGISSVQDFMATYSTEALVRADVLTDLGGLNATKYWSEGVWSDYRGWPSAVTLDDGRLWWAGKDRITGSVSDDFYNYNPETEGDSAPVNRIIGIGPVDDVNFMLNLQKLVVGTEGAEFVCRSNALDEPLTRTNFNIRLASDQGSSSVNAIAVDKVGLFVQRGGTRLYELNYDGSLYEYTAVDLTLLQPEVCQPKITRIAAQRQPDTRIHCVLSDGTVAVLIYDRAEDVKCWLKVTTDGTVEDVVVLPGDDGDEEDKVYYVVNRTINGSTVRYLERWAKESDCVGGTLNHQLDSYLSISQSSSTTITGLNHLEAETVYVWANGKDLGSYTVSSGSITVSEAVTTAIVGLTYTAQWKSSKLAYGARQGTALLQAKQIRHFGAILQNTHYQGLEYGRDFTNMDPLPLTKEGATIADDTVHSEFDEGLVEFPGTWDTDSRLCLQATAPKPCTILAAVMGIETNEKF